MDREPKITGAVTALLIALPFGLVLAWSQSAGGPSRGELAAALSREGGPRVAASDLKSLRCTQAAAGYQCRWEQRVDEVWQAHDGRVSLGGEGWRMKRGQGD